MNHLIAQLGKTFPLSLSPLEGDIFFFLCRGESIPAIASRLGEELSLVEKTVDALLERTGYVSVLGLVADHTLMQEKDLLDVCSPFFQHPTPPLSRLKTISERKWALSLPPSLHPPL